MSKSYFFGDARPQFVLSDQDGVLVGHMSFQEKKIICSPGLVILFLVLVPDLCNFSIFASNVS